MKVLIIEDDAGMAESMMCALQVRGHDVFHAWTLAQARAFDPAAFDLILCDYELPDGTGLDYYEPFARMTFDPITKPRRILWSGLDRTREVAGCTAGEEVDRVYVKSDTIEVLDWIENGVSVRED